MKCTNVMYNGILRSVIMYFLKVLRNENATATQEAFLFSN